MADISLKIPRTFRLPQKAKIQKLIPRKEIRQNLEKILETKNLANQTHSADIAYAIENDCDPKLVKERTGRVYRITFTKNNGVSFIERSGIDYSPRASLYAEHIKKAVSYIYSSFKQNLKLLLEQINKIIQANEQKEKPYLAIENSWWHPIQKPVNELRFLDEDQVPFRLIVDKKTKRLESIVYGEDNDILSVETPFQKSIDEVGGNFALINKGAKEFGNERITLSSLGDGKY